MTSSSNIAWLEDPNRCCVYHILAQLSEYECAEWSVGLAYVLGVGCLFNYEVKPVMSQKVHGNQYFC